MLRKFFQLHPEVIIILKSLEEQPGLWAHDAHYLYLKSVAKRYKLINQYTGIFAGWMSPLCIWIANGPDHVRSPDYSRWNAYSRRKLWNAFKRWKKAQTTQNEILTTIIAHCEHAKIEADAKIIPFRPRNL